MVVHRLDVEAMQLSIARQCHSEVMGCRAGQFGGIVGSRSESSANCRKLLAPEKREIAPGQTPYRQLVRLPAGQNLPDNSRRQKRQWQNATDINAMHTEVAGHVADANARCAGQILEIEVGSCQETDQLRIRAATVIIAIDD